MTRQVRGWISPRKERELAIAKGERMADDYEKYLGRSLTPAELRHVHAEARRITGVWSRQLRTGRPS